MCHNTARSNTGSSQLGAGGKTKELLLFRFSNDAFRGLAIVLFLLTLGTVFQAFLPPLLSSGMILMRLVIIPAFIVASIYGAVEVAFYLIVLALFFLCEFLLGTHLDSDMLQVSLSILVSFPYFKAGIVCHRETGFRPLWLALLIGLLVLNVVTIVIYMDTLSGGSMAEEALVRVRREGEDPLFRFALGNAIEHPALVTMGTVAAALAMKNKGAIAAASLFLNLLTALISQSRFVVLIAVYPFLRLWKNGGLYLRTFVFLSTCAVAVVAFDHIGDVFISLKNRFEGDDSNSAKARLEVFSILPAYINTGCLTFGNGVNSSMTMMETAGLGYRTVEAAILQLLYDLGLIRTFLLGLYLYYTAKMARLRLCLRPEFMFVVIQVLIALPIMTFTPLYVFCAGVLCSRGTLSQPKPLQHS